MHQNVTFCDPLNNEGNSKPLENNSNKDTPGVLRRSSRRKITTCEKYSDDLYTVPKKILQKILDCEVQANRYSSNKNLRYAINLHLSLLVYSVMENVLLERWSQYLVNPKKRILVYTVVLFICFYLLYIFGFTV